MYYDYEIIDNILYLYLDYKYEFGLEIMNYKDLEKRSINFIKNHEINFTGDKVYLIINNIVVKPIKLKKIELI